MMRHRIPLAPLAALLLAACGRSALDVDPVGLSSSLDGGLPDGRVITDGGDDGGIVPPPRDDGGRLLSCGSRLPGPILVTHRDYFGDVSCIDATEVTNAQYAEFLAAAVPLPPAAPCASNVSYTPALGWPAADGHGDDPVVGVDWCDARDFCLWSGKHLCQHVGADPGDPIFAGDPELDQWSASCTKNRAESYPYGARYDRDACNGRDLGVGHATPARLPATCEGSDRGLYGMSGNVWEWEDDCTSPSDESGLCLVRGGSFRSGPDALRCESAMPLARNVTMDDVGFRCCLE